MYRHVGIVTGLIAEAEAFRGGQGERDEAVPFYCRRSHDWSIACGGIGKAHAAMAASHLANTGCDLLVSLGVAGALQRGIGQGPFWLTHAVQHDYGAVRAEGLLAFRGGAMPLGKPGPIAFAAIEDPGSGLLPARIASGDSFIEDAQAAARIAKAHDAQLVDMESGAIAQVAEAHGIGFAGIRSVTDDANDDSADHFQDNLEQAAQIAARAMEQALPLLLRP